MSDNKNSIPVRYNVDIFLLKEALEQAAIEDSQSAGKLYNIPEYVRETLAAFLELREYQRDNGIPLSTPADIVAIVKQNDTVAV